MVKTLPILEVARTLDMDILHMGDMQYMKLSTSDINRPGLQFTDFFEFFVHDRVQVVGPVEMAYLNKLDAPRRAQVMDRYFSYPLPCVIFSRQLVPPQEMMDAARKHGIPLLSSEMSTTKLVHRLVEYLNDLLAPEVSRHGVFVDVYGVGIMLTGESGIGKSETALELVKRGHRLVADDVVLLKQTSYNKLVGYAPDIIRYLIEIRGIGIIDMRNTYGVGAVLHEKTMHMIIHFEQWEQGKKYERLGAQSTTRILDAELPYLVTPVMPGRNMAIMVEVAAMNLRLRTMGTTAKSELDKRMIDRMQNPDKPL